MRLIRPMTLAALATISALAAPAAFASDPPVPNDANAAPATASAPIFDAELATRYGADERGMRRYVLVVLKTGPTRMPDGEARKAMFAGHMANIGRLAKEGKLAVAGPFMPGDRQRRNGRRVPPVVRLGCADGDGGAA